MQIGCQQFCIDPPFPVNRMLREEKHQAVSGHLYCRIAALYPENDLPFYHVSIDTVELWKDREDRITQVITEALGRDIHCICSATHSHNCPGRAWRRSRCTPTGRCSISTSTAILTR